MTEDRGLHIQRLREATAQIPQWRIGSENALSPDFTTWKGRVEHSLEQVFGKNHHHVGSFRSLAFWWLRAPVGQFKVSWNQRDQQRFLEDLTRAERILADALAEAPTGPAAEFGLTADTPLAPPAISVTVLNVLAQTTEVTPEQLSAQIGALQLDPASRAAAVHAAEELAAEIHGQQRWPFMAKYLEALQALGKSVYDRVALPLLLEYIKQQAGLR